MNSEIHNKDNQTQSNPGIWRRQLPLETETCFFILVNALDEFLTYMLLYQGPEFRESNPLANWILANFEFKGMVYFKFILVAFVTVVAQIIAKSNPRTARWLLIMGTLIVSIVVIYSCTIWVLHSGYFVQQAAR